MWFDGQADQFDDTSGLPPPAGRDIAQAVVAVCGGSGDIVLDLGSGTGAIGSYFAKLPIHYLGFDRSMPMLEVFLRKLTPLPPHMLLFQADSDCPWPIRNGAVGVVFASRVVQHVSAGHVVREVWRVCRPGGYLFLGRVVRAAESLPSRLQRLKRALLAEHGLHGGGGEQAVQQLVALCQEKGATPRAPSRVAQWTRSATARQLLANWEKKPQLTSRSPRHAWSAAERDTIVRTLTERAQHELGDLDRPEAIAEEYWLYGVQLPSSSE